MVDTQNKHWANDKSKFGLKMLQKMGWKGEGLGKNQDGLKSHVKITKRSTNLGLGTEDTGSNNDRIDAFAGLKSWQRTTSNFSDVLASLNATKSDEVEKMRKHKKKKEKKKKKKKSKEGPGAVADDKKTTSGTLFRNVFRKRELKNKDISSMNSKDIGLILGTAAPKTTTTDRRKKKRKEVDMAGEAVGHSSPSKKKHKKEKKAKKKKKKKKAES